MARKSTFEKLQETVVDTVRGAAKDPVGTVRGTARGTLALGRMAAGEVVGRVTRIVRDRVGGTPLTTPAPDQPREPAPAPEPATEPPVTPADVARVVEKKPARKAPAKKAPAKKTPAKSTPSGRLPAKKAAAKTPAAKTPAAKKAAAKTPTQETPTQETPTKSAAEVVEDTSVPTPVGTTGADVATNPDTTDTDLQQPGTAPLMDPAITKQVAAEAETGARGADPGKG
jgi:hypothetical protein